MIQTQIQTTMEESKEAGKRERKREYAGEQQQQFGKKERKKEGRTERGDSLVHSALEIGARKMSTFSVVVLVLLDTVHVFLHHRFAFA